MGILDFLSRPQLPGFRFSPEVTAWAASHFPHSKRATAGLIAGILVEQVGDADALSDLQPKSRFDGDINVFDWFDATDYADAVEAEFRLSIPRADREQIHQFGELVDYVHAKLQSRDA